MDIPTPKHHAWKAAEAELAHIERAFKSLAQDLSPSDRARVTQRLDELKAARLRVRLLFEEVMKENALMIERLADCEEPPDPPRRDPPPSGAEDWLA
jgi:hypothetical protein